MSPSPQHTFAIPSSHQSQTILLDSSIRDWVVLPLLILMVEAGLLRHYLSLVLKMPSKSTKVPKIETRVKSTLMRASKLRSGAASFLSQEKWEGRRMYFSDSSSSSSTSSSKDNGGGRAKNGYLGEEIQWIEEEKQSLSASTTEDGDDDIDMPDPMAMMGPMKGQIVFMVQNMVMMQGIAYFFQGFVLVKVPLPLTMGFKLMFQRGLDLTTLDTSYVSSVSWYFLVMFGLRAFFKLVIEGDGSAQKEQMDLTRTQAEFGLSSSGAPPGGSKFDPVKALTSEQDNLELTRYRGTLDDAERRLLGKKFFKKLNVAGAGDGSQPGYDIFASGGGNTAGVKKNKSSKMNKKKAKAM